MNENPHTQKFVEVFGSFSIFLYALRKKVDSMSIFPNHTIRKGIISVVGIIILTFCLLFYNLHVSEENLKDSIFDQQIQRQTATTKLIADHIKSDFHSVLVMLDGLANSVYLQQDQISSSQSKKLVEEKYMQFNNVISRLFVLDSNNMVVIGFAPKGEETFVGSDFSLRDWVIATKSNPHIALFSNGFELSGMYRIFISYPIVNRDTGQLIGIIGASLPSQHFFAKYSNIGEINSQFLVVLDNKGIILADGGNSNLVGQSFFGAATQQFIDKNEVLNNLTRSLLAGNSGFAVYDYGKGERLTTQSPVIVNGEPLFFIQLVTPTAQIYSALKDLLSNERLKMFSLLTGSIAAVVALLVFLMRWNTTLREQVRIKTIELQEEQQKQRQLEESYEGMKRYLDEVLHEIKSRPIQRRK
jgi:Cache domain